MSRPVVNVLTVHYRSDRWLGPQLDYLERHCDGELRVWAVLNDVDPGPWAHRLHHCDAVEGTHPEKLNHLARLVADAGAAGDEVLVFLDGDALPIAPLRPAELLASAPLAAVRRDENGGDPQPHPCFCVTTLDLWRRIDGDWSPGTTWRSRAGATTTDVGGNLYGILRREGIAWTPLLRSNRRDVHPLWYGVYGDVVYHHGAGFRSPVTRADFGGKQIIVSRAADDAKVPAWVPVAGRVERALRVRAATRRRVVAHQLAERQQVVSRLVYDAVLGNPAFHLAFTAPDLDVLH